MDTLTSKTILGFGLTATAVVTAVVSVANPHWYVLSPTGFAGIYKYCVDGTTTCYDYTDSPLSNAKSTLVHHARAAQAFMSVGIILSILLAFALNQCGARFKKSSIVAVSGASTVFLLIGFAIGAGMRNVLNGSSYHTGFGYTEVNLDYGYGLAIASWVSQLIATYFFNKAVLPAKSSLSVGYLFNLFLAATVFVSAAIALSTASWYALSDGTMSIGVGIIKYCQEAGPSTIPSCIYFYKDAAKQFTTSSIFSLANTATAFNFVGLVIAGIALLLVVISSDSTGLLAAALKIGAKKIIAPVVLLSAVFLVISFACGAGMRNKLGQIVPPTITVDYSYGYGLAIVSWSAALLLTLSILLKKQTLAEDVAIVAEAVASAAAPKEPEPTAAAPKESEPTAAETTDAAPAAEAGEAEPERV